MELTHRPSSSLQAFHMQCQHCILGIRWSDLVTNLAVTEKTGLPDTRAVIDAHDVLRASVQSHPGWRRKPLRPQCTWLRDVLKVTRLTAREAWTAADDRKGWRAQ